MEKIPTPNIDPPPKLINLKYVNRYKLHTISLSVLQFSFTFVTVYMTVKERQVFAYCATRATQISYVKKNKTRSHLKPLD